MRRILPTGMCWCGCGAEAKIGAFFLPGHDRVAEAAVVLAEYGGVPQFLAAHGYAPNSPDRQNPREEIERVRAKAPWKYQPLADYLASQVPTEEGVTMAFSEVDSILASGGTCLPPSARVHRPWWANDRTHTQAKAWMDNGWESASVDLTTETVTFVRRADW